MSPEENHGAGNPATKRNNDWTIMLYIAADGTLANFGVESLKQVNRSIVTPLYLDQLNASVRSALDLKQSDESVRSALATAPAKLTKVVVAAQFSVDAPGGQAIRRYIFDDPSKKNLHENQIQNLGSFPPEITEQEALADFLKWVYENGRCNKSKHYALILWSHGPELFLQPPPGGQTGDSASLYLTPEDLRIALESLKSLKPKIGQLDIVGFDACSMSMFEMAYELKGLAKLMIASQEEVPDASFPYYDLVKLFRERGNQLGSLLDPLKPANVKDLVSLLTAGVKEYLSAYQDYIVGKSTNMNPVTLSVLNLTEGDPLKEAIRLLACALLKSKDEPDLPRRLIQARTNSQDYAGGLYVDLHDFCTNLSKQLDKAKWEDIKNNCGTVLSLLKRVPTPDSFILINGAVTAAGEPLINEENTTANHGISIYLPYLTNQQFDDKVDRPMVKGGRGTDGAKGLPDTLNETAAQLLLSAQHSLILTTENYYGDLKMAADTAWYSFITDQWTKAIAETDPDPDFHYSARQIEINRHRSKVNANLPQYPQCGQGL
jgi:hypothetical protein